MSVRANVKDWLEAENKTRLQAWARDGLSDEQISSNMGINPSTLYRWKKDYPEFRKTLKIGKEVVDIQVENALFKKANGYTVKLKKTFKVKRTEFDPNTGRKVAEYEELQEGVDEVHVPADVVAQIFWLKNRKPEAWRDKVPEPESSGDGTPRVIDDVPAGALPETPVEVTPDV